MSTWMSVRPVRGMGQTVPLWSNSAFNDSFFDDTFNLIFGTSRPQNGNVSFGLNVAQDENNYYVWALMPGVSPDKLEINALDNKLTISAEVSAETFTPGTRQTEDGKSEQPKLKWLHRELPATATRYQRELELPTNINPDQVQAFYDNGVLRLIVPQATAARPHKIAINTPARPELNEAK